MLSHGALSRSESPLSTADPIPKKEEWAIINKYKAMEFERMKQQQHMLARHKKQQFRQALDNQLNSRNNAQMIERQQDKLYSQQLAEKAENQRLKEQQQKRQRYINRRHVDEENVHHFGRKSRSRDGDTGYHLEIGVKSQKDHMEKASHFRKEMIDTLDLQLRQKNQEKELSKLRNQEMQEEHKRMQENYFKPENRKMYHQNQRIYDYYQQLQRQRALREKDLEHKLVDEARQRQMRAEMEKEKRETDKKLHYKEVVAETLGQQVKELHRKRVEDHYTNPQDISFKFISNIFQPKYKGYDKQKYQQELQRQAQEQRLKKQIENHMSPQEYKLNLNQLSKAVLGDFAQQNYLDRSLGAIGEKYQIDRVEGEIQDDDVDVIKSRVKNMRHRGNMSTIV